LPIVCLSVGAQTPIVLFRDNCRPDALILKTISKKTTPNLDKNAVSLKKNAATIDAVDSYCATPPNSLFFLYSRVAPRYKEPFSNDAFS
jgi:hypothetical protein